MLLHLRIRDFAIMDEVELAFSPGFTVITGETGAGKSIVVDALCAVLGGRASQEWVRSGAASAEVEALFRIDGYPLIRERLAERDLLGDDPDLFLIRRVIGAKGRAKVVINGHLSTLATLAELVRGLVDISGQHEQQSLMAVEQHIVILDAFGQLGPQRQAFRHAYEALRAVEREYQTLLTDEEAVLRRADFLRFQWEEIARLNPVPGEIEQLEAEQRRLVHVEKLTHGIGAAETLLYSDDGSVFDKLGKALSEVQSMARIDESLAETAACLQSAQRDIEDAARTLQRYADQIEADPDRLEQVEERLTALRRICRKHGGSIESVVAQGAALQAELERMENMDSHRDELVARRAHLRQTLWQLGQQLSMARHDAARRFDRGIIAELVDMDLSGAVFQTHVQPCWAADPPCVAPSHGSSPPTDHVHASTADDAATAQQDAVYARMTPHGFDDVRFLWSANPGEPARDLAKIASGGELSRVMLAVKSILTCQDLVSVYVFDEVDTGVGGRAADCIGRKIQRVAEGHQALVITHLAPIAARADHHIRVSKARVGERTVSTLQNITGRTRADEIARMIDGAQITPTTRRAAQHMLERRV